MMNRNTQEAPQRPAREDVGATLIGVVVLVGLAAIFIAPQFTAAVAGGGLASGGAYLIKKAFGK